ncbi:MAG: geranyl transferase [Cardiobacteriales bacterium]|nr:MAG: geranyl transferase [Cardiobacteriales bacterium]
MPEETYLKRIELILTQLLPDDDSRIARAMRYSTLNGGKRLRAALVYACAKDFGLEAGDVDHAAAAIECIHAYSLIHDDLPAMDNDGYRRGKPSNHKAFDEATAILAGDALNTFAFAILTQSKQAESIMVKQIQSLSLAAGHKGMVGGQMLDIIHTENHKIDQTTLEKIHRSKTAALFGAALHLGASPSPQYDRYRDTLTKIGKELGLAFQIIDDILDTIVDSDTLGKTAGKDQAQQKQTYVSMLGIERSRELARAHSATAVTISNTLPNHGHNLTTLIYTMSNRRY